MSTRMEKITKAHKETMGETGAGISNADEIDMDLDNPLTNAWGVLHLTISYEYADLLDVSVNQGILPMVLRDAGPYWRASKYCSFGTRKWDF